MPHHSYTSGSKEVPACVRNIFSALIFGNISYACAKKIFNYCNALMLVEVKVRDRIAVFILEIIGRSGRHFLARFLW